MGNSAQDSVYEPPNWKLLERLDSLAAEITQFTSRAIIHSTAISYQ